ncbi:MAG: alanine--glyoxylate aminotransferase family protein [Deltaproteobacteria bacterium]|nr:alanine--glyoxylate aminotransferase family protein [Deltaproteobacteria bacterium]
MQKQYLLTAGPTPVPEEVLTAMARPVPYHRAPAFAECLKEAREGLQWIFQTAQPVLVLSGSGTAAMDAAVSNFLSAGDKVLVVRGGKFGERWAEIASAYGVSVVPLDVEWGRAVDPAAVARALDADPAIRAVYATATETSTGVRHPVDAVAAVCHSRPGVLCIVDAISALGVYDLPMDKAGFDVVVAGSQKALMLPPGLAFVAASEKAWQAHAAAKLPRFYLDLGREKKSQTAGETAFTPAVSLVVGLRESLRLIRADGLEATFARHAKLARATRAAGAALGLEPYADPPSDSVTAFKLPAGLDGSAVVRHMRTRYGVTIAGGQGKAKGKILRLAHLGWYGSFDIITAVAALEMTLADLGAAVTPGAGVAAAETVLREGT